MKIAVVTDSGSTIYQEPVMMRGLYRVPLQIIDEKGQSFLEGETLSSADIYQQMRNATGAYKTSLPPLGRIEDVFAQIRIDGYDHILAIPITSGISSTIETMRATASRMALGFDAIDCYTTAYVQLNMSLAARRMLDEGMTLDAVISRVEDVLGSAETVIIPDDLNTLVRGGRLRGASALIGGLLRIKPILRLAKDTLGRIVLYEKVRTMTRAMDRVVERFRSLNLDQTFRIYVVHVLNPEMCQVFATKMRAAFPDIDVVVDDLISTVGVHVGIGALAAQCSKRPEFI